jgi:predicted small integral membrane protein
VIGTLALLVRLTVPAAIFNRAKVWGVAGMTVGFGLWFFGFLVVAGEYFASWQSKNGTSRRLRSASPLVILGVLVFVSLPDSDPA